MKSWVKLYTEITRDPKVGSLTWAQRGIWTALLALAGEMDARDEADCETGEVDTVSNIAWRLRCEEGELREALGAFEARDMVSVAEDWVTVTHYGERQRRAESDRHAAVLERVKRHRTEKRAARVEPECNAVTAESAGVTATCNESVTPLHVECNEVVTRLESETDTDSDTEAEESATALPSARAGAGPNDAVEPTGRRDPRSRQEAVVLVKAITGRMPPKGLYDSIIQALAPPVDEERLRKCYQAWLMRGYKVTNWAWLFEWYGKKGIPEERGNGQRREKVKVTAIAGPGMSEAQKRMQAVALAAIGGTHGTDTDDAE